MSTSHKMSSIHTRVQAGHPTTTSVHEPEVRPTCKVSEKNWQAPRTKSTIFPFWIEYMNTRKVYKVYHKRLFHVCAGAGFDTVWIYGAGLPAEDTKRRTTISLRGTKCPDVIARKAIIYTCPTEEEGMNTIIL